MITSSELDQMPSVKHGFFTRRKGVSEGIYAGLNCGYGSGDSAANVDRNRGIAMARLGLGGGDLNTLYQVHSSDVVYADAPWSRAERPKADGLVTDRPGIALGIMTADCTPVLFADPQAGVIGAAHAGWKGALGGILAATVAQMETLGARRDRIAAVVGPCIHQSSYEVGPEFEAAFVGQSKANAGYFVPSQTAGHYMFDLVQFVLDRLRDLNLGAVDNVSVDTYANEDLFFSYRRATHRAEPDYGRGLSAIALRGD